MGITSRFLYRLSAAGGKIGRQVEGRRHVKDSFFPGRAVEGGENGFLGKNKPQVLEALREMSDGRVLFIQSKMKPFEDFLGRFQRPLSFRQGLGQDHEVIGVPYKFMPPGEKRFVQFIQEEVCKNGGYHCSCGIPLSSTKTFCPS